MIIDKPGQVICADITYVSTNTGMIYLQAFIDSFTRQIISYQISVSLKTDFVLQALLLAGHKISTGSIIHTDRGSQYTSSKFTKLLASKGYLQSFSNNCYENAGQESFFGSMKHNHDFPRKFTSKKEAVEKIQEYIAYYNTQRIHAALLMAPDEYYQQLINKASNLA